ncbi:hypothetical protein [Flavihumibacter sp. ZG627]|uniref:hypothetical protein n=1 Tax=Flavihumibacter sp. ZG627 TaxID=1463156 RepID=UPI0005807991|nr:hypothetical protein [Flavihumibacter sp. ZG627]KIC90802.1 hypothetical protein HY58_07020 [Flavihumibacter sp. ZG627]
MSITNTTFDGSSLADPASDWHLFLPYLALMKLVTDLFDTDMPHRPAFSLYKELLNLERDYRNNQPVIHQVKQLMVQYPGIPDPACLLAKVYADQGKEALFLNLLTDLRKRFPDSPLVLNTLATGCLQSNSFDELELMANLNLPFEAQFPNRKQVDLQEWFRYELASLHWMLANQDHDGAYQRILSILPKLEEVPHDPLLYAEIGELLEDLVEQDEATSVTRDLQEMLQKKSMAALYHPRPPFRHPETAILLRPMVKADIPLLLQLMELPKTSLLADLRQAIRDSYFNHAYYKETIAPDYFPDLVLVGFTVMVAVETDTPPVSDTPPDSLHDWLDFLHKPADFIDFWLGDYLNEFCFLFAWKLGRNHLSLVETALREPFRHEWAPVSLATALILTALKEPQKKPEVLDILERTLIYWLNQPRQENPEHLLATLLEYGIINAYSRFLPLLEQARAEDRLDPKLYGSTMEAFIVESEYWVEEDIQELGKSAMSLQDQLEYFFSELPDNPLSS